MGCLLRPFKMHFDPTGLRMAEQYAELNYAKGHDGELKNLMDGEEEAMDERPADTGRGDNTDR